MHPAISQGTAAGQAAALEDRAGRHGRAIGAELVLAARESAEAWAADAAPLFLDRAGSSVIAYAVAFMDSYERWMDAHTVKTSVLSGKIPHMPEGDSARP